MQTVHPSPHPLVAHKVTLLRDKNTEPKKFRALIREISSLMIYEATTDLKTQEISIETPLATTKGRELLEKIGLVPILRSGLGMVEGVWDYLPKLTSGGPAGLRAPQ